MIYRLVVMLCYPPGTEFWMVSGVPLFEIFVKLCCSNKAYARMYLLTHLALIDT